MIKNLCSGTCDTLDLEEEQKFLLDPRIPDLIGTQYEFNFFIDEATL